MTGAYDARAAHVQADALADVQARVRAFRDEVEPLGVRVDVVLSLTFTITREAPRPTGEASTTSQRGTGDRAEAKKDPA